MIKTFTHNELIQYVYDELQDEVKEQLERALAMDQELAEACSELLVAKGALETLSSGPSPKCISNILIYSQNLSMRS
jgi:anti-sigma factor RsiW